MLGISELQNAARKTKREGETGKEILVLCWR